MVLLRVDHDSDAALDALAALVIVIRNNPTERVGNETGMELRKKENYRGTWVTWGTSEMEAGVWSKTQQRAWL